MKTLLKTLAFLILTIAVRPHKALAQSDHWPKTFLWKISGNGMPAPSYLFGTMQVQDKRVFSFPDSVYAAIRNTSGFAMEVDMQAFMLELTDPKHDPNELITIERNKLERSLDSMLITKGYRSSQVPKQVLIDWRKARVLRIIDSFKATLPDGQLYGIASALGKELGFIHPVQEEVSRMNNNQLIREALMTDAEMRDELNNWVRINDRQDLAAIAECVDCYHEVPKSIKDISYLKATTSRIDSLLKIRSWFISIAVGVLPGENGIINRVRQLGYKVDPVFSGKRIDSEKYFSQIENARWKKFNEPGFYSVELPGEPVNYDRMGAGTTMKMLFDPPTATFYLFGYLVTGTGDRALLINAFKQIAVSMGAKPETIEPGVITGQGQITAEQNFNGNTAQYSMRLIIKEGMLYILIAGIEEGGEPDITGRLRFFNSFVPDHTSQSSGPTTFTIPGKGFSIVLPGKPKRHPAADQPGNPSLVNITFDLADPVKGMYYLIQLQEAQGRIYFDSDSAFLKSYTDVLEKTVDVHEKEALLFQGWPAVRVKYADKMNNAFQTLGVRRGRRLYVITGGGPSQHYSEIEKVLSTFTLEDIPSAEWKLRKGEGFSTYAPDAFYRQPELTSLNFQLKEGPYYLSIDTNRLLTFEVYVSEALSPGTKADNDFFEAQLEQFVKDYDIVRRKEFFTMDGAKGLDFSVQRAQSNIVRRFRILVKNQKVYVLHAAVPESEIGETNIQRFFTDFRVSD